MKLENHGAKSDAAPIPASPVKARNHNLTDTAFVGGIFPGMDRSFPFQREYKNVRGSPFSGSAVAG